MSPTVSKRPLDPANEDHRPVFLHLSMDELRPRPPTKSREEIMKEGQAQTLRISTSALEHYNKKHHADYELVEALLSCPLVCGDGIWFHCNYKAKVRAVSGEESDGSSIKLFFSEVKIVKPSNLKEGTPAKYKVTACRILDGVKQITGCDYCRKIIHPAGGFRKGLLYHRDKERVSSLRSRLPAQAKEQEIFEMHVLL